MKRASWKGYFRLGNLAIPVKLYAATMPAGPDFVQVHKTDMAPVKRQLICSIDGDVLAPGDIIRAVEHDGKYVPVEATNEVGSHVAHDIIVRQFTDVSHVHSLYYDKPYYLVADPGGEMAYATLRNALRRANKLAVVTYSLYGRAHIGVIGPTDGIMILQQLKYAAELVSTHDLPTPSLPQPSPDQVGLAVQLVEKYTTEFYLEDYRNEQLDTLHTLVERAIKGLPAPKPKRKPVTATADGDLADTLAGLLQEKERTLS